MNLLDKIPEKYWESIGAVFGFSASALIMIQIIKELTTKGGSSMSFCFVAGFFVCYFFWFLYGLRYRRLAVWLSNALASLLQFALMLIVLLK